MRAVGPCSAFVAAIAIGGCLDHELPPEGELGGDVFIAVPRDFCGFRDWIKFELRDVDAHAGAMGPLVVYLKQLPPLDATSFPVGAMLVKTVEIGDPSTWEVHGMVKRGGNFNARGALDWEFLDLSVDEDCTPRINWRGDRPPRDHGYKSLPGLEPEGEMMMDADCNSCHGTPAARENDGVLSKPLRLGDLS